jgi:hypothetical protein
MMKRIGVDKNMFQVNSPPDLKAAEVDLPDLPATVVRYFTTESEYKKRLPKTIEVWRGRFSENEVIFEAEVDTIPSLKLGKGSEPLALGVAQGETCRPATFWNAQRRINMGATHISLISYTITLTVGIPFL